MKRLGFPEVREMKIWEEEHIAGLRVLHTPCPHWGARFGHDTHRDYGGFVVASEKRSIGAMKERPSSASISYSPSMVPTGVSSTVPLV